MNGFTRVLYPPAVIDLDANAGAPLDPRVRAGLRALLERADALGNPSSLHRRGQAARAVVEDARRRLALAVGADPLSVTFTSGGTEADALAIVGGARALREQGRPHGVLSSRLEHPAVVASVQTLSREGYPCVWAPLDDRGRIFPQAVANALRMHPEIGLVSLMAANHELGNRYDVPGIVNAVRSVREDVWVHTDAVQGFGKVDLQFESWGVDMLSISSHKIGGPAGCGALVHRKTIRLAPMWHGGQHERGRRPGTEALLLLHAFGLAAELSMIRRAERGARVAVLRERLLEGLRGLGARIHGDLEQHTGNTINAAFPGCDGQLVLIALDLEGVAVSTGAACSSGSLEPSPVLLALGLSREHAAQGVRFSLGPHNDAAEVDTVLGLLPRILDRIRTVGPEATHASRRRAP